MYLLTEKHEPLHRTVTWKRTNFTCCFPRHSTLAVSRVQRLLVALGVNIIFPLSYTHIFIYIWLWNDMSHINFNQWLANCNILWWRFDRTQMFTIKQLPRNRYRGDPGQSFYNVQRHRISTDMYREGFVTMGDFLSLRRFYYFTLGKMQKMELTLF